MAKKKYISMTGKQYVFPVNIKEKRTFIEFSGPKNEFVTDDEDVQNAVESSSKFKNGEIALEGGVSESTKVQILPEKPKFEPATFENVVDINGAIEVLKGEPYKLKANQLNTPEKVKAKIIGCNIDFPNWTVE